MTKRQLLALLLTMTVAPLAVRGVRSATVAVAAPGDISTYAGGGAGDGGGATNAAVSPVGVAVDGAGNVYIADSTNCRVRKVAGGIISTIAGTGLCGFSGDGAAATSAQLNYPQALAVDASGIVYISDSNNCRIREIVSGTISTIAGNGTCSFGGDTGTATSAALNLPRGIAVSSTGDVYVADAANCRVRKIAGVTITTVAGTGACGFAGDGGLAILGGLSHPAGVALDSTGSLYIADTDNCRVRVVPSPSAKIFTAAGTGSCTFGGDTDVAASAQLNKPEAVATDASGNLYIADTQNCRLRKVTFPAATINTIGGTGSCGFAGDGGIATSSPLNAPAGIAVDSALRVIGGDTGNCRVRSIASGTITTLAGTGGCQYGGDGAQALNASLSMPGEIALDSSNNLYVADVTSCRVRKIAANGVISTVAGNGMCGYGGDGGPATAATLDQPHGVAIDAGGNLYIADTNNCLIRKRDTAGVITTIAGNGICAYGGDNGGPTSASLNYPESIAVVGSTIVIADTFNCRIRRIVGSTITTVAGNGSCSYAGDGGPPLSAALTFPYGVAVDAAASIYIADTLNCRVRKVSGGTISLVAGNGACGFGGDNGPATAASVNRPVGLKVDGNGSVFIADTDNCRVRLVAAGTILTVAGSGTGVSYGNCGFSGDGGSAPSAKLNRPQDVAVAASGVVYVSDSLDRRIRSVAAGADADVDGVPNAQDNCPLVSNAGQQNNDRNFIDLPPSRSFDDLTLANSDTIGDACDPDDDNDGLTDSVETSGAPCASASGPTNPLLADTDGDGVLDGAECALGSNPNDASSKPVLPTLANDPDHDGLSTAFEQSIGTDPNVADTDGDGLSDGLEYKAYNTSPRSLNTDGDACSDGREVAGLNQDTVVNSIDLGLVAQAYGPKSAPQYVLDFDTNKDGTVNSIDLALVARQFGSCP